MCEKEIRVLSLGMRDLCKRSDKHLHVLGDLSLTCEVCKTPEVHVPLARLTDETKERLMREANSTNSHLNKMLKGKEVDSKKFQTTADKELLKFFSKHMKGPLKLKPKFKIKGAVDKKGKMKIKEVKLELIIGGTF